MRISGHIGATLIGLLLLTLLAACLPNIGAAPRTGAQCTPQPVFEAPPLNTCAGSEGVSLAIVGDVLLHWQLQQLGYRRGFSGVWSETRPFLAGADIAIANLEGPVAPGVTRAGRQVTDPGPVYGTEVYTGYPTFNYHPVILRDLKALGIDLVSTANNHAMDRGAIGADLTLTEISRAGLDAVGTIRGGAARNFVTYQQTSAGKLAFIACSFSTNGMPNPRRQVLLCYEDRSELLSLVRREAMDTSVAGVIVLPHWGQEYRSAPDANQQKLARDFVAAGAIAVVGTHPHAVQPFTTLARPDGTRIPVVYSTGNFIAIQDEMPSKVEAMALLELCKNPDGHGLIAQRFGWIAMQMELTSQAYWVDIAPPGTTGPMGLAFRHLSKIAPGYSAQPVGCERPG